jgi:hypothetical protein
LRRNRPSTTVPTVTAVPAVSLVAAVLLWPLAGCVPRFEPLPETVVVLSVSTDGHTLRVVEDQGVADWAAVQVELR